MDFKYDFQYDNLPKKSKNHLITWKKGSNINTCDLNKNCMKLEIDIKKNNNIIINDDTNLNNDNNLNNDDTNLNNLTINNDNFLHNNPLTYDFNLNNFNDKYINILSSDYLTNDVLILDRLPTSNLTTWESFQIDSINYYDYILIIGFIVILFFVLLYKKNNFKFN